MPPSELEWNARIVFGNDTERLNFQRGDTGDFIDARVQQVYDACVIAELVQAVGRGRLVLYAKRVVVVSALALPGITERAVLFDETDWEVAGGLANLASTVADREAAEKELKTVADFQQAYGCSERHARRLWEQAGGKEIAIEEEKALVKRAKELTAEHSQRKTADILGFSLGKLQSLLKKAK